MSDVVGGFARRRGVRGYEQAGGGPAPEVIVPPFIEQGSRTHTSATLALNTGAWTVTPTSYTYAWAKQDYDGTNNVSLGSGSTYAPVSGDNDKYVYCDVTPYNGATAGATVRTRRTQVVSGAKTTITIDWVEQVATDAYLGSASLAAQWGGVDNRISIFEDGVVRAVYLRFVAGVRYMRVMKRTGTNTWVQDVEKDSGDSAAIIIDPLTNDPYLVGWPAPSGVVNAPSVYYGASYASSQSYSGTWVTWDYDGDTGARKYGGISIGADGTLTISENYMPSNSTANNQHRYNWGRRFNGSWTIGTQQQLDFLSEGISPNGERYAYPFTWTIAPTLGASTRHAVNCLRDVSNGGGGFWRDARKLYTVSLTDETDSVSKTIANNPGVDYVNPSEAFLDSKGRVWTVLREGTQHHLRIDNIDGALTERMAPMNLSNFNDGYGRVRVIEDSRGRFYGIWMGNGAATGLKSMQLTPSGSEPTGTITVSQGSVTDLSSAINSGSAGDLNTSTATMMIATPRGGNYIDNRVYAYLFGDVDASNEKIVSFCISLPD